jgi:hypothetical protein
MLSRSTSSIRIPPRPPPAGGAKYRSAAQYRSFRWLETGKRLHNPRQSTATRRKGLALGPALANARGYGILLLAPLICGAGAADDGRFYAGAYSFSDELGGFRITDISGSGSTADPIVVKEELSSASAVTLVVRAARPLRPYGDGGNAFANGFLHLRLVAHNGSGQGWLEFEFELEEELGSPSVFGDGLSFNQRKLTDEGLLCDRFADYHRDYAPYDRLLFREGHVDPKGFVTFGFFISDFTPDPIFYIRQDPRIPFS